MFNIYNIKGHLHQITRTSDFNHILLLPGRIQTQNLTFYCNYNVTCLGFQAMEKTGR